MASICFRSLSFYYDQPYAEVFHDLTPLMKRALHIERRVQKDIAARELTLKNIEKERVLKLVSTQVCGRALLTINNLDVKIGQKKIIDNLSLTLSPGDRVAVTGPNGSGKSTLLNAVCGDIAISAGTIKLPAQVRVLKAYQEPLWQTGKLRDHLRNVGVDETHFRRVLGEFAVVGDVFERPLQTFSRGQLKKVDLYRTVATPCDLLLWDEPMNYIEIMSCEQIEAALLIAKPTLLFVEHDRYFIEAIATDVMTLRVPSQQPG